MGATHVPARLRLKLAWQLASVVCAVVHPLLAPAGASLPVAQIKVDNSLVRELAEDPRASANWPNQREREVYSGHYVRVAPKPLPAPELVAVSSSVADLLGIARAEFEPTPSEGFVAVFSGGRALGLSSGVADGALVGAGGGGGGGAAAAASWATPYGISIYGEVVYPNGAGQ